MKRLLAVMTLLIFLAATSTAQGINGSKKSRVFDAKFMTIFTLVGATTVGDVESTFAAIRSPGVHEVNPLMKPFIRAGRPATYAVRGGVDAAVLTLAWKLKRNRLSAIRKLWWFPPMMLVGYQAFAAVNNQRNIHR